MSNGSLKCVGSSYFLKKKFGNGYRLICVKKATCHSDKVTQLLQRYIPDIQANDIGDIGTELSYQLSEANSNTFHTMFRELEDRSDELGIDSYGISLTTLEEVFMKVGSDSSKETHDFVGINGNDNLLDIENRAYGSKEVCKFDLMIFFCSDDETLILYLHCVYSKLCGRNSSTHWCNVIEQSNQGFV